MIRSLYHAPDGAIRTDLPSDEFGAALLDPSGLLWVDFEATSPESDEPILRNVFGFHPLAIDDALQQSHVPKVDDWGEYLYVVLHAVVLDRRDQMAVDTLELDVFLGRNYLITHHDQPIGAVEKVWAGCRRDERHLKNGSDHLLYKIADEIAASYLPVVEEMDDAIDVIEGHVFERPSSETVEHIFAIKRSVLRLRRILGPQREVLNKLARDDYAMIDAKDRVYFRDVYDHLVRMHDITESVRDLVSGALDTYLSVVNNRMNEIMKTLTLITTLFMPLTFVVGFFGMNFFQPSTPLDIWTGAPAFVATLMIMFLMPIGMYLWIRRRGWL
jgi:magnesium transporter